MQRESESEIPPGANPLPEAASSVAHAQKVGPKPLTRAEQHAQARAAVPKAAIECVIQVMETKDVREALQKESASQQNSKIRFSNSRGALQNIDLAIQALRDYCESTPREAPRFVKDILLDILTKTTGYLNPPLSQLAAASRTTNGTDATSIPAHDSGTEENTPPAKPTQSFVPTPETLIQLAELGKCAKDALVKIAKPFGLPGQ